TFVGQVNDNGSINNIAFVQIDPQNDGFQPSDPKLTPAAGTIDAQGNFSFKIPNLLPGQYTVGVQVVDLAGNATKTSFTFIFPGPSATVWRAQGAGPISVPATAVD